MGFSDNIIQYEIGDAEVRRWFDVFLTSELRGLLSLRHVMKAGKYYYNADLVKERLFQKRVNAITDSKTEVAVNISHPFYPHDITFRIPFRDGALAWDWLYVERVDITYGIFSEKINNLLSVYIAKERERRFHSNHWNWSLLFKPEFVEEISLKYAAGQDWADIWADYGDRWSSHGNDWGVDDAFFREML